MQITEVMKIPDERRDWSDGSQLLLIKLNAARNQVASFKNSLGASSASPSFLQSYLLFVLYPQTEN